MSVLLNGKDLHNYDKVHTHTTPTTAVNIKIIANKRFVVSSASFFCGCCALRLWYNNPDVNISYSPFLRTMVPLGEEASHSKILGQTTISG